MPNTLPPRKPDEYFIPNDEFDKVIARLLTNLRGSRFPTDDDGQPSVRSESLNSFPVDDSFCTYLKGKGVSVIRNAQRNDATLILGRATWHLRSKLELNEQWSLNRDGVAIYLETWPMSGNGNYEDAAALARILEGYWSPLHENVKDLVQSGGKKQLSWQDLDIEPSLFVEEFVQDFFSKIEETFGKDFAAFAEFLHRQKEWSPLRPDPVQRAGNGALLYWPSRVPASAVIELRRRWLGQLFMFGKKHFPQP